MKRTMLIAGAACAALGLAACGGKPTEPPNQENVTPDANPAATVLTPADETLAATFLDKAAAGNLYEIEAGKIALAKSKNAEVTKFAQAMIDAHTQTGVDMQKAIAASGLAIIPAKAPAGDVQKMLTKLESTPAADFDKKYAGAMADGHQRMLDLLTHYANAGDNQALKDFAAATAPAVQMHLNMAEGLKNGMR